MEEHFKTVLDCAFEVHNTLGPGLLENTYKQCLAHEISLRGLKVEVEMEIPVIYKNIKLKCGYRIDILAEDCIIVEIKSTKQINDVHLAQIMTYLKLSNKMLGLLANFNVKYLKNGIKRVVNRYKI